MIALHRFSSRRRFHLNADLIAVVEACPDTVVTLTTGIKVMVDESPEEVVAIVDAWRAGIAARALRAASVSAPARLKLAPPPPNTETTP